jgi:hypothetical protein
MDLDRFDLDGPQGRPGALLANCPINGNANPVLVVFTPDLEQEAAMGRGILLWLLGIPIPIIILILIFWH